MSSPNPTTPPHQTAPFVPDHAPFTPAQRAWLNGFLAAVFCRTEVSAAIPLSEAPAAKPKLNILFGSQSGNAESLAKKFGKEAEKRGFHTMISTLDKVKPAVLSNERYALFITSTWGEGDPPDNAVAFWDSIKEAKEPKFLNLGYSVLALGDTNYQHFCGFGKSLDARLAELGAKRILDRVDCDVQFDELAAQWQKGVFETLEIINSVGGEPPVDSFSAVVDGSKSSLPLHIEPGIDEPIPKTIPVYTRTHPFAARLLVNRQLTGQGSAKDTRHYEISLEGSGITYEVGDALGIIPQNDPDLVSEILAALGYDGEEEVPGAKGGKIPIRLALSRDYQIRAPHREFLNAMAEHDDADQYLKELVRSDTRTELDRFLWGREIIDFLLDSPGVKFEPAEFVGLLKNLQPRLYSIASSIKAHPEQVHLTVDTVRYESHGRTRKGVCSNFLAERCGPETPLPVFMQTTKHFRLPEKGDVPIIMVGPGTGIAPFRAFLQERKVTGANGGKWLFFGAQKSECDFFYRDELEAMRREGVLTRLDTAFSRDQDFKIYVQHRMTEHGAELWKWLEEGAHFYVCGDASRMAKDVDKALHQIIETNGGLTSEAAAEYVQKLKGQKRYQRDVY